MIVNGTYIPDIPADIQAKHPYWFILYVDRLAEALDGYQLYGANEPVVYIDGSLFGVPYGIVMNMTPGYSQYYVNNTSLSDGWRYLMGGEESCAAALGTVSTDEVGDVTTTFVWANHNVREVIAVNEETFEFTYGGLYYPPEDMPDVPASPSANRYSIAKAILDAVARQIMRLTDSTEKVKPEEFEGKLAEVKAGGGGGSLFEVVASGIIPDYPKGYATSTLSVEYFETNAVGT